MLKINSIQSRNYQAFPNRQNDPWNILNDEEIAILNRGWVSRTYFPGDTLFYQGDDCEGVFCIQSGLIGVSKYDAKGNSVLLYLANPGETLGYRALFTEENFNTGGTALKTSQVSFIKSSTVRILAEMNPKLSLKLLQMISKNLGATEDYYFHNSKSKARARFAHLLSILLNSCRFDASGTLIQMQLPIERKYLAAMIGVSPETLSRTARELENDGIVKFSKQIVAIPNLENLIREFNPSLRAVVQ